MKNVKEKSKKYIIRNTENMTDALVVINRCNKGFAIVVDEEEQVIGVVTDGDIRRNLIVDRDLSKPINTVMRKDFTYVKDSADFLTVIDLFKDQRITFLPILDENYHLVNIITKKQMQAALLQDLTLDLMYDFSIIDEDIIDHEVYSRPWGFYKTTVYNEYYKAKVISVKPQGVLSLQSHKYREEHWTVVHGKGESQIAESQISISCGSHVFIPKNCKHRLKNTDAYENLIIIEVQIGDYLGEDDVMRYEDLYGRVEEHQ